MMGHDQLLSRITVDPDVMVERPTIRGMRITAEHILETLAAGTTQEEPMRDLPVLEEEDIQAVLLYAAEVVGEAPVYRAAGRDA